MLKTRAAPSVTAMHQDQALEHRLEQRIGEEADDRIGIDDAEAEGDRAQHHDAEDRADGAAGAAEQRGAADDDGRDRVERVGAGLDRVGIAAAGLDGEVEAGEAGEQAAERIGGELGAVDPDARHVGGGLVGADRVAAAADLRVAVRDPDDQTMIDDQDDDRHRDAGDEVEPGRRIAAPPAIGGGKLGERVGRDPGQIAVDLAARRRAEEQRDAGEDAPVASVTTIGCSRP